MTTGFFIVGVIIGVITGVVLILLWAMYDGCPVAEEIIKGKKKS